MSRQLVAGREEKDFMEEFSAQMLWKCSRTEVDSQTGKSTKQEQQLPDKTAQSMEAAGQDQKTQTK